MVYTEDLKNGFIHYYYFIINEILNIENLRFNIINFIIYWYNIIKNDIYDTDNFKNRVINYYNIFKTDYLGNTEFINNIENKVIRFYNAISCNYLQEPQHKEYNLKLKEYREKTALPLFSVLFSFVVYQSNFLSGLLSSFYKNLYDYLWVYLRILFPIMIFELIARWKKLNEMIKMAKSINKKTKILQSPLDRINFLILGDANILYDYGFDYDEVKRRYEEVNKGNLVDTQRMGFWSYASIGIYGDVVGNCYNIINDVREKIPNLNLSHYYQNFLNHSFRLLQNGIRNNQRRIQ